MKPLRTTGLKVGIFMAVMLLLTVALFAIFGQYRGGAQNTYTAIFDDVSSLKSGDSVRVAGVKVGTVKSVSLQPDNTVTVGFGADRDIAVQILNQPLATQTAEPPAVARISRRLEDWVRGETEIRLP